MYDITRDLIGHACRGGLCDPTGHKSRLIPHYRTCARTWPFRNGTSISPKYGKVQLSCCCCRIVRLPRYVAGVTYTVRNRFCSACSERVRSIRSLERSFPNTRVQLPKMLSEKDVARDIWHMSQISRAVVRSLPLQQLYCSFSYSPIFVSKAHCTRRSSLPVFPAAT